MDSEHLVVLDAEHPGFRDPTYRQRRDEIARLALAHREEQEPPTVPYAAEEHEVWRKISERIRPVHEAHACRAYLDARAVLRLPEDRIPQLSEVNALLAPSFGYRMLPAAGLVTPRAFLERLGRRVFLSTQYIRHASRPFYTPEPDVVHEIVGHAATLAHPDFVRLNGLFGQAVLHADPALEEKLIRLYWWTAEFGVVHEDGVLKACGAGLLSSVDELLAFEQRAQLVPFDIDAACATPFDPTAMQTTIFVADSFAALMQQTCGFLERTLPKPMA